MVKVVIGANGKPLPCEIYLDGYLKDNLDALKKFVDKNWDGIGFICGYEGDGKTVLAQQCALYLDPEFSLDRVVFNAEQFVTVVESAPKNACIVWDEADELGSKWQSNMLMALKRVFKRIRKNNLYIFLVTPTIFDLNKYFVVHRTRFLLHVYSDGLKRGMFKFYNRERKKELYMNGYKMWNMNAAKANFFGGFVNLPKGFPIDQDAYEDKKDAATEEIAKGITGSERVGKPIRLSMASRIVDIFERKNGIFTQEDVAYVFGCNEKVFRSDLNDLNLKWPNKGRNLNLSPPTGEIHSPTRQEGVGRVD